MMKKNVVQIQQLKKESIIVNVKGVTPLLMEKMNMDVVEFYDKKKGQKVQDKNTKTEEELLEDKIHYTKDGNIGFPSAGFWKGMVEVAPYIEGLDKKRVRGSVRFLEGIIPLTYKTKTTKLDYGIASGMTKAPRKILRPEFSDWSCTLKISYNRALLSPEQIVNLVNLAGFQMGIGGWRPEHGGIYGQYEIAKKAN